MQSVFKQIIMVFLGGGLGSVIRFGISCLITLQNTLTLPWATLFANILSISIVLMTFFVFGKSSTADETLKHLILIGICGGLSTFSTFSFETAELLRRGNTFLAISNVLLNNIICIGLIYFLYQRTKL